MSITATFYSFSKRKNSTKTPSGGTSYGITIKEPCTITAPRIVLDRGNPATLNYCYIPSFDRYYFITDWTSDHGFWVATCAVDVLASWRDPILNSTQYVARSASKKDTYIVNAEYPLTKDVDVTNIELLDGMDPFPFKGVTYVLAVANNDSIGKVNGIQYLGMTSAQISNVMGSILNDSNTFGFGSGEAAYGLTGAVARALIDPLQYIGESYILPFEITDQTTTINNFRVGFWPLTHPGGTLKAITPNFQGNAIFQIEKDITLIPHPQALTHGRYLNSYPYTEYVLNTGCFGVVRINVDDVIKSYSPGNTGLTVTVQVKCDMYGKALLTIFTDDSQRVILARQFADVAVPFSLTQSKNNILSWAGEMVGTGAAIAGGSVPLGSITGVINGIDNAFPKTEIKGQNHSMLANYEHWYLTSSYKRTVAADQITTNLTGDPLCEVVKLSTLTGFCQVAGDIWLECTCTENEDSQIKQLLTSGFFIE